jgi:hypothetical protein
VSATSRDPHGSSWASSAQWRTRASERARAGETPRSRAGGIRAHVHRFQDRVSASRGPAVALHRSQLRPRGDAREGWPLRPGRPARTEPHRPGAQFAPYAVASIIGIFPGTIMVSRALFACRSCSQPPLLGSSATSAPWRAASRMSRAVGPDPASKASAAARCTRTHMAHERAFARLWCAAATIAIAVVSVVAVFVAVALVTVAARRALRRSLDTYAISSQEAGQDAEALNGDRSFSDEAPDLEEVELPRLQEEGHP